MDGSMPVERSNSILLINIHSQGRNRDEGGGGGEGGKARLSQKFCFCLDFIHFSLKIFIRLKWENDFFPEERMEVGEHHWLRWCVFARFNPNLSRFNPDRRVCSFKTAHEP